MAGTSADSGSSVDPISLLCEDVYRNPRKSPSPARSIVLERRTEHTSSPWRLRIAVEAEPEDPRDRSIMPSPHINRKVIKTTTRLPLKQPGPVSPRRSVKTQITATAAHQYAATSGPTFIDLVSTRPDDFDLNIDQQAPIQTEPTRPVLPAPISHDLAPGDTTIMESEDFSMVSVASLDSHRTASNQISKTIVSTLKNSHSDQIDSSQQSTDSPSTGRVQTVTPDAPAGTPLLPPRTANRPQPSRLVQTPLRNSVVRSGKVLQDIIRTPEHLERSHIVPSPPREDRPSTISTASQHLNGSAVNVPDNLPTAEASQQVHHAALYPALPPEAQPTPSSTTVDPMSWIATGAPKLASPISPLPPVTAQSAAVMRPCDSPGHLTHNQSARAHPNDEPCEVTVPAQLDATLDLWQEEASRPTDDSPSMSQQQHTDDASPTPSNVGHARSSPDQKRVARVDSAEPDPLLRPEVITPPTTHSGVTCDDTGIFWKGTTTRKRWIEPSLDEPSYLDSPFSSSEQSCLLQGTVLDRSPHKQKQDENPDTTVESSASQAEQSLERNVSSIETESKDSSLASSDSVGQQLLEDLQRQQTRHKSPDSTYVSNDDISQSVHSYEERLNRDSPGRITIDFGDSIGPNSTLPQTDCPHLFDNTIPHLTPRRDGSFTDQQISSSSTPASEITPTPAPKNLVSKTWSSITSLISPSHSELLPQVQPSSIPTTRSPKRHTTPDPILRLRRKYGLHENTQPFTYAHIRTLHRMLNSVRHHGYATIIPVSGPLPPDLASRETDVLTTDVLHAVHAFTTLLLPRSEIEYLQRNGEWGDDETRKSRGRDTKGRHGSRAVFGPDPDPDADAGDAGGQGQRRIRLEWIVDVVSGILVKEARDLRAGKKAGGTVKVVARP